MGKEARAQNRSRGRSVVELYNTERPHSSLGYKPPAPEAIIWPGQPPGSVPSSAQAMAEKPVMH
ncbi:integrase core domain-containing protein [Paracoccus sp. PXZ]|uniref:integrase core domain-containing protein n=1 Tax=Rhodoligotrophos defluvii TaxID=2561934 RepID=UPI003065FBBC